MARTRIRFGWMAVALTVGAAAFGVKTAAQAAQGQAPQPPRTPRAAAPVDITGNWVAVITEDWRFRMVTPPKGDAASIPLNAEGTRVTAAWDMQQDIAANEQCRAFGAAGIMRMPVRLRISWQDDNTLKVDIDNGTQTRLFHFDKPQPPPQADWQGFSLADWETAAAGAGIAPAAGGRGGPPALSGSLKVVTNRMKAGYLRRNGVPYSANAVMTEYFDRTTEPNGDSWLVLTTLVDDPTYLNQPLFLTTHFKREADGSKFNPRPCTVTPSVVGEGN